MIEVKDLDSVLKEAKHVLLVNDRIPPGFYAGPNVGLVNSVHLYRQLLRWRDDGVTHLQIETPGHLVASFNDPWYKYYTYTFKLMSPDTKITPLKLTKKQSDGG